MEFRLLGPLEAVGDDGEPIALGGKRPRALLAMLLVHPNEAVSTDRLVDAIWGEQPPASAQSALQVHVHALRKVLGSDRIVTRTPGYLVRVESGELDVQHFEELVTTGSFQEADDLWRGPALADFAYEPFAQAEAARLEERRLAAIEARIEADLDAGRHREVVAELDVLVSAHPRREGFQALRMLALYRSGRQTDALEAYRTARAALDEIGLAPSPALRGLERRILEHDPSLGRNDEREQTVAARATTTLVGRDLEFAAVTALLRRSDVRLVTLSGTGGTGKTRLAQAICEATPGAVFVDLAPIVDARLLLSTIAAALDLGDVSGREIEALADELTARPRMVVLDNLEQLPDAFASIAVLLDVAQHSTILATSRVPLRIAAEHEYRVPPLAVPELGVETADAAATDAVRLYVERARVELPEFALSDENASAVSRICRALDGLPLAIELAAARVRVLGPEGTAKRLGERLSLLTRSAPDLPERRRSLRATIDWSYRLLDEDARRVFRALSVFAGGATLDGIEAVVGAGADVPASLEALLDSGLVTHDVGPSGEPRFGMLETIREFAAAELRSAGEETEMRERHLDHMVAVAVAVDQRAREGTSIALFDEMEAERDNVRAALVVAAADEDPTRQIRLVRSLRFFLGVRGPADESRRVVAAALARRVGAPPEEQGHILISAGIHAVNDGDPARSLELLDEAVSLLEGTADVRGLALAHGNASTALALLGDTAGSIRRAEIALEGFRASGANLAIGHALAKLAQSHEQLGDYPRAREYLAEALEQQRPGGDSEAHAYTLAMLGYLSERAGDLPAAMRWTSEAIEMSGRLRKDEYLGYAFLFASDLVERRNDRKKAGALLGAAETAFRRALVVPQEEEAARGERVRERLRRELGAAVLSELESDGAALELEAAVELAVAALVQAP